MKTVGELHLMPVWVNPNHRVSTAKVLLTGHKLMALGVVDGGTLLGTVSFEELAAASDSDEVAAFMRPVAAQVGTDDSTRSVAELMARESLDYVPVLDRGRFLGMVTAKMLLQEMGRSWDPLTGLSWSDALRDWGIERLKEGRELTIVFIDLDDFGSYNKRFGHIVGDRVLIKVANYLRGAVDPQVDVLCRYGGDEFAIATVRPRRETEDLLRAIERGMQGTLVAETENPVAFSAGIFGGRRSKERENIHFSSTLDTLINMASKGAMAAKAVKKAPEESVAAVAPSAGLVEVFSSGDSANALTTVILRGDGRVASGVHTRGDATASQSAVLAAAKAFERLHEGQKFELQEVQLSEDPQSGRLVTVIGLAGTADALRPVTGTSAAEGDVRRAAVEALLAALTAS